MLHWPKYEQHMRYSVVQYMYVLSDSTYSVFVLGIRLGHYNSTSVCISISRY